MLQEVTREMNILKAGECVAYEVMEIMAANLVVRVKLLQKAFVCSFGELTFFVEQVEDTKFLSRTKATHKHKLEG